MNLSDFFKRTNTVQDACCVTVSADGFSFTDNNIVSISARAPGKDPVTVYVKGATIGEKTTAFTGLTPSYYASKCVELRAAVETIAEHVQSDVLVTNTVNSYTQRWLSMVVPELFGPDKHTWFDVLPYIRFVDEGNPFPVEAADIKSVCDLINGHKPVTMKEAIARCIPHRSVDDPINNLPVNEQRIHQISSLWDYCLHKEL